MACVPYWNSRGVSPDIVSGNMLNYNEALIMAVPSGGDLSKCLKIQESGTTNLV
jgi:hypothetical protein